MTWFQVFCQQDLDRHIQTCNNDIFFQFVHHFVNFFLSNLSNLCLVFLNLKKYRSARFRLVASDEFKSRVIFS